MDIKGLQYFIAAAECLNFTHAAQECFVTQTAISQHIVKMEEELGFQLFRRTNRMVELTEAGRVFYEHAQRIVKQYGAAVSHCSDIANGVAGNIGIMFPSCLEGLLLIQELRLFLGKYPEININVQVVEPKNMYDKLKNKESDVAICWPWDFGDQDELEILSFRQYPVRVCVPTDHPFAKLQKVSPMQIQLERAVILEPRSNPKSYRNMRNSWVNGGFEPDSVIKVDRLEEILLLIELGLGIGLLPTYVYEYTRGPILSEVHFIEIDCEGAPPMQDLAIIHWRGNRNPALDNFLIELQR